MTLAAILIAWGCDGLLWHCVALERPQVECGEYRRGKACEKVNRCWSAHRAACQ